MSYADWAETLARSLLEEHLPRRWAHSRGVAATARTLGPVLGRHTDLVTAAAWLHDIGYAPRLHGSGFHPLDGARYPSDVQHADDMLCRLVAHHSCAVNEAAERGLLADLVSEFKPAPRDLADALIYCDMATGPGGQRLDIGQRMADIRTRYGPGDPVTRAMDRSAPELAAAFARVASQLTGFAAERRPPRPPTPPRLAVSVA